MKNSKEIINDFINNGYKPMDNIPGNRIFYTDNTASTLVWAEGQVVIEHYFLFPNTVTPVHGHPFGNQLVYIQGDLTCTREKHDVEVKRKVFTDSDKHILTAYMPDASEGWTHGFIGGPRGAIFYNMQIWPDIVTNPVSAAIEYTVGDLMGPVHQALVNEFRKG